MKNINIPTTPKQRASANINEYIKLHTGGGTVFLAEAILGLLPGLVTEWESSAIFARDNIQMLRDSLAVGKLDGFDHDDVMQLLTRWISFYEEVHYDPLRHAEIEGCIVEAFGAGFDDDQLADLAEPYELRIKALSIEEKIKVSRYDKQNKQAA